MRSWVLAAVLLAAAAAPPVLAADIDDDVPPKSGLYERYPPKGPPPPFYYEDDERYPPPAKKYSDVPPPYGKSCVRSEDVRDRLTSLGWNDFHAGQPAGEIVTLRARRSNGRLFELTLHRCTGQIVEARALEPRPFGPYAYKGPYEPYGPRRWDRHEYEGPWFERPYAYRGPRRWHRDY